MGQRLALVAVVVAAAALAAGFRTSEGGGGPTVASVGAALDKVWSTYSPQLVGLCAGAVDGRVAMAKCYGKKAPGSSVKPGVRTLFRIESVSKTFAATLLALRVHQHKVSLSDPLKDYVPVLGGQAAFPSSVTLLDLADHYSGLPHASPDASSADDFLLQAESCLRKASCRVYVPEHKYSYSNWGVSVLGTVLGLHDGFSDGPVGPVGEGQRAGDHRSARNDRHALVE